MVLLYWGWGVDGGCAEALLHVCFTRVLQKTKNDKEKSLLMTKIGKLESLCRAMQAERQARKVLEGEKIGKVHLPLYRGNFCVL